MYYEKISHGRFFLAGAMAAGFAAESQSAGMGGVE